MANLLNGDGYQGITAQEDADYTRDWPDPGG